MPRQSPLVIPMPVPIKTPDLLIRPLMPEDGPALQEAYAETWPQLTEWMHWAHGLPVPTVKESEETAHLFYASFVLRKEFHAAIVVDGRIVGMVGFCDFDWDVPNGEIGYWCRTSAQGKGYITKAVNAMTRYGFEELKLKRIHIICDVENAKSCAVAERLGYTLEWTTRYLVDKPGSKAMRTSKLFVRYDADNLPPLEVTWPEHDPALESAVESSV